MIRRFFVSLIIFIAIAGQSREMGEPDLSSDEFMQRFTASYGVLSEKEPPLNDIEIVMLKKVAPLLRINKTHAENFLKSMINSEERQSASFNYLLGNLYFESEQYLLAEEQYKAAIEGFPDFQRAWTNLGVLKLRSGDTRSALIAFLKAVELGDSKAQTFGMLGFCHYSEGNYISAEVAYDRAILAEPNNLDWLEGKAQAYLKAELYMEAIRMQDELISSRPRNVDYWLAQTNAFLGLEDYAHAARNLEIVRSLGKIDFQSLYLLGGLYTKLEMHGPAKDAFLQASKLARASDTGFLVEAARVLIYNGEMETSKTLSRMIDSNLNTSTSEQKRDYQIILADLAEFDGDPEQALAHLEKAEKLDPIYGSTLIKLARLYSERGNRDKAYMLLDRAEKDPEFEYNALLVRAKLLIGEERFAESQIYVGRALKLNANDTIRSLYQQVESAAKTVE